MSLVPFTQLKLLRGALCHLLEERYALVAGCVLLHELVTIQTETWQVPAWRHWSRSLHSHHLRLRVAQKGQTLIVWVEWRDERWKSRSVWADYDS